jgi:septum formation protein
MLVLASASPRRRELLLNAGIAFIVQPADIPENLQPGEQPQAFAERLAREKAMAVFKHRPDDVVLGADTIVVVDGEILGKPRHRDDASRMLQMLSGRQHQVITGVCLVGQLIPADIRSATTLVTMAQLSGTDIQAYIESGEPMDKAGAYAIQGIASRWITKIEGDYSNVVGLPIPLLWQMLRQHLEACGFQPHDKL